MDKNLYPHYNTFNQGINTSLNWYWASIDYKKIEVLLQLREQRNTTRKKLNPQQCNKNYISSEKEFESFFIEQIDVIWLIWKEILKNVWKDFNIPKIIFFENSIQLGKEDFNWEICYDPNNNTIVIKKSSISFFQNSKLWALWAIAHEVWHSIQVQLNIYNSLTKDLAENYADLIIWYTFKIMVEKWLIEEQDVHEVCFIMADLWDDCEFISLMEWEKNIHWDWNERMWNVYKWYSSEEADIINTFDIQQIAKNKIEPILNILKERIMHILI